MSRVARQVLLWVLSGLLILATCLLAGAFTGAPVPATYETATVGAVTLYVAPTGSDTNDCQTVSTPCATKQNAIKKIPDRLRNALTFTCVAGDVSPINQSIPVMLEPGGSISIVGCTDGGPPFIQGISASTATPSGASQMSNDAIVNGDLYVGGGDGGVSQSSIGGVVVCGTTNCGQPPTVGSVSATGNVCTNISLVGNAAVVGPFGTNNCSGAFPYVDGGTSQCALALTGTTADGGYVTVSTTGCAGQHPLQLVGHFGVIVNDSLTVTAALAVDGGATFNGPVTCSAGATGCANPSGVGAWFSYNCVQATTQAVAGDFCPGLTSGGNIPASTLRAASFGNQQSGAATGTMTATLNNGVGTTFATCSASCPNPAGSCTINTSAVPANSQLRWSLTTLCDGGNGAVGGQPVEAFTAGFTTP